MHKTRDLSTFDYLQCLQREYINAELRKRIYPRVKDKRYYEKTMFYKKEKIEDIAQRNKLDTIFNSEQVKRELYDEIYNEFGLPNFLYRNTDDELEFRRWDVINYYAKKEQVKVKLESEETVVGTIVDNSELFNKFDSFGQGNVDQEADIVMVKIRGKAQTIPVLIKNISRII